MGAIRKYIFVLGLALTVVYVYAPPSLGNTAKLPWLDDIGGIVSKFLAHPRREPGVSRIDPVAAANVDEDLDYRIAERTKSADGWRSFLAAHPHGPHAPSARAEFDKLIPPAAPLAPALAQAPNGGAPAAKAVSEAAFVARPAPPPRAASLSGDEICKRDEDRLQRLSSSATSEEAMRLLNELRCEKLRPQLFRLTEHLDDQELDEQAPPAAAVPTEGSSSRPAEPAAVRQMGTERPERTRWRLSSHRLRPRRDANRPGPPSPLSIFLADLGAAPRTSNTVRRIRAAGGGSR